MAAMAVRPMAAAIAVLSRDAVGVIEVMIPRHACRMSSYGGVRVGDYHLFHSLSSYILEDSTHFPYLITLYQGASSTRHAL